MATSADKDDKDELKDDATEGDQEESDEKETDADDEDEKPTAKPAPVSAAKPASAAKPVAKVAAKPGTAAKPGPARPGAAAAKRTTGPSGVRPRPAAPATRGSFGKSLILFVIVFGGLAAAFAFLGREENTGPVKPKWAVGQTVDVEITVVKSDQKDLSCASSDEVGGKHCAFEAQNKPWSKGDNTDDKKLLKPYTTTDRIQFTAAGVWSDPATTPDKLPATRFSLKCKYKVEGTLKKVDVRWDSAGAWYPNNDWYAGSVSDCKVQP
jgi:hypothetical protein